MAMAVLTAAAGHLDASAIARAARYRVELFDDWKQAAVRWNEARATTPFQDFRWLGAWYGAFTEVEPVIAVITDARTLEQVALLPLVRHPRHGLRIIEFADLDLTDYNAPLLGPAAPRGRLFPVSSRCDGTTGPFGEIKIFIQNGP